MWYIYTMEYYWAIKIEWNNVICSNMDGPRDYHTKWSKSDRERQIPYDITYMWNLKYDANEPIYETETDSQTLRTDLWLPRGRWSEGGMDWEFGISRCKLLYIEWANNKVLLYSTGNYIHSFLWLTIREKNMKRMYMYICITESLCYIVEINTTL